MRIAHGGISPPDNSVTLHYGRTGWSQSLPQRHTNHVSPGRSAARQFSMGQSTMHRCRTDRERGLEHPPVDEPNARCSLGVVGQQLLKHRHKRPEPMRAALSTLIASRRPTSLLHPRSLSNSSRCKLWVNPSGLTRSAAAIAGKACYLRRARSGRTPSTEREPPTRTEILTTNDDPLSARFVDTGY